MTVCFSNELHQHCWIPSRPHLAIKHLRTRPAGNCYSISIYVVTSLWPLKPEALQALHKLGHIGFGQSFKITSQCDGKEEPTIHDEVPPITISRATGETVETCAPPCNEYTGKLLPPRRYSYYTYTCEVHCDSGD